MLKSVMRARRAVQLPAAAVQSTFYPFIRPSLVTPTSPS